ncbi:unnamed protein product [Prorocentrum cordatum]|uniref:Uncharacterized protein n=1 Tax=Prorocentrum cordatum TaxID=2364126 RepID=A0ABN9TVZ5_9DINO|nr:unnamed protein product [Polarella glacialis]
MLSPPVARPEKRRPACFQGRPSVLAAPPRSSPPLPASGRSGSSGPSREVLIWAATNARSDVLAHALDEERKDPDGDVAELLAAQPVVPGEQQPKGTALHVACRAGHVDIVRLLLLRNAPLGVCDHQRKTPYEAAVEGAPTAKLAQVRGAFEAELFKRAAGGDVSGAEAIARALMAGGVDVSSCDQGGYTPVAWAELFRRPPVAGTTPSEPETAFLSSMLDGLGNQCLDLLSGSQVEGRELGAGPELMEVIGGRRAADVAASFIGESSLETTGSAPAGFLYEVLDNAHYHIHGRTEGAAVVPTMEDESKFVATAVDDIHAMILKSSLVARGACRARAHGLVEATLIAPSAAGRPPLAAPAGAPPATVTGLEGRWREET